MMTKAALIDAEADFVEPASEAPRSSASSHPA